MSELGNRSLYIGGSDIAAIMGISPFKSRNSLLKEKRSGEYREFTSAILDFGHEVEKVLIEGRRIQDGFVDTGLEKLENNDYGFPVICHFDRVVEMKDHEIVLIECKTSGQSFGGKLPEYYNAQIQFYMHFLNLAKFNVKRCLILFAKRLQQFDNESEPYAIGGTEEFFVDYDESYFADKIEPALKQFIADVQAEEEPAGDIVPLPEEQIALFVSFFEQKEAAEAYIKDFTASLKRVMEENGVKSCKFGKFTATLTAPTSRKSFDKDKAKEEDPDGFALYEQMTEKYVKETPVAGSLRISKNKGE